MSQQQFTQNQGLVIELISAADTNQLYDFHFLITVE